MRVPVMNLSKPTERGDEKLARKFAEFLKHGKNLALIKISEGIAEAAGRLRGRSFLFFVFGTLCL